MESWWQCGLMLLTSAGVVLPFPTKGPICVIPGTQNPTLGGRVVFSVTTGTAGMHNLLTFFSFFFPPPPSPASGIFLCSEASLGLNESRLDEIWFTG